MAGFTSKKQSTGLLNGTQLTFSLSEPLKILCSGSSNNNNDNKDHKNSNSDNNKIKNIKM